MVAALSVVTIDALAPRIGISTNGGFAVLAKTVLLILAAVLGSIDAATRSRNMAAVHQAMEKAQAVSQRVFESMDEGILLSDIRAPGMPLAYVNPAFERITGYSAQEALGKNCRYLQGADRLQPELHHVRAAIESGNEVRVTLRNYRKDGSLFWNDLHLLPVLNQNGERTHFVGILRDVTEFRAIKSSLNDVYHLDRLTSVANRYFFYDKLSVLLQAPVTNNVLVAKVDIAHFHEINTSYGFEIGDLLLAQVAERLKDFSRNAVRKLGVDEAGLVGKLAADEFAVAIQLEDPESAEEDMDRLRGVLLPKFVLLGATLEIRFAIGFTLALRGDHPAAILRHVGVALQESKRSRQGETHRFTSQTATKLRKNMHLTAELQQALTNGDFELHFQPKAAMESGDIIGAEALIRWRHPVFGLQYPALFIPRAEGNRPDLRHRRMGPEGRREICSRPQPRPHGAADGLGECIATSVRASGYEPVSERRAA